ncbi:hypothetical protein N7455_004479 [Penicillium solitum]|uniref:uncharacterized protein n=1 Tax=Penicillium solitum TaxID=60172 RepID=UPI0032C3E2DD|nr:hypothetical protein N7455_004479 [Penicillium solitum]
MASRDDPTNQALLPDTPRQRLKVGLDTPIPELLSCYGESHIHFPKTLRQYYDLYSTKLDSLIVFFHQILPQTTETRRYPTAVEPWLTYNYEGRMWLRDPIDIESMRCRFGEFVGLSDELVDPGLSNPRSCYAQRDKPPKTPYGETISGAGVVQKVKKRRDKLKGVFGRLGFGK